MQVADLIASSESERVGHGSFNDFPFQPLEHTIQNLGDCLRDEMNSFFNVSYESNL